jgi:hypothetical protein
MRNKEVIRPPRIFLKEKARREDMDNDRLLKKQTAEFSSIKIIFDEYLHLFIGFKTW